LTKNEDLRLVIKVITVEFLQSNFIFSSLNRLFYADSNKLFTKFLLLYKKYKRYEEK